MSSAAVIRYAALEPLPWRNGLGVTRSIRNMPERGGWSLSIATIEEVAEFSVIPATQRVQLAIDAVRLDIDGVEVQLRHGEQARFTGEQRVSGASIDGASQVLNLMHTDGSPTLKLAVIGRPSELPLDALAVVVLAGTLEAHGATLGPLDTLLTRPGARVDAFLGEGEFAVVSTVS